MFQHTAARRRLDVNLVKDVLLGRVSTHSRPKAAGAGNINQSGVKKCFNTQPPEGGWLAYLLFLNYNLSVSTHSRPKAAGGLSLLSYLTCAGFNTQPPEGGWAPPRAGFSISETVSTHSRPKAAGFCCKRIAKFIIRVSTHSRPKAAGWVALQDVIYMLEFQHTAARRRLGFMQHGLHYAGQFQHTAARRRLDLFFKW